MNSTAADRWKRCGSTGIYTTAFLLTWVEAPHLARIPILYAPLAADPRIGIQGIAYMSVGALLFAFHIFSRRPSTGAILGLSGVVAIAIAELLLTQRVSRFVMLTVAPYAIAFVWKSLIEVGAVANEIRIGTRLLTTMAIDLIMR